MLADVELRHHVLLTEPGAEFKAERHLRADGFDPYVPTERVTGFRAVRTYFGIQRRKVETERPIFRGYIMVPLNRAWSFGRIHSMPGLRERPFLMFCGQPAVLSAADVERLRGAESALKDAPIQGLPFKVGDQVRILEGPFALFAAEIARLDDAARIELLMDMLGARVKVHVAADHIEALN